MNPDQMALEGDGFAPLRDLTSEERKLSIQERFALFHERNPQVYRHLVKLAHDAQERGFERIGIEMLWQVLRWEIAMRTRDPSGFKLNDHYRSRYSRLLMAQEPGLSGLFETRRLRAA